MNMNTTVARPRVLCIDDTPANLLALGAILSADFDLQFAVSGADGIRMAKAAPPELILLDVMMPELDGYETCLRLKGDSDTCDVPVIFLTALDSPESETRGLEVGAVDFLSKPVNPAVVRARISTQLRIKRIEREALQREARFRTMIEAAHDGILLADGVTGRFVDANPTISAMTGYNREELLELDIHDLHPASERAATNALFARLGRGEVDGLVEVPMKRKDGTVFHAEMKASHLELDGQKFVAGFFSDVTERKKALDELRMASNVFIHAREGILITDGAARIVDVNRAFTAITGYERNDVIGQNPRMLSSGIHDAGFYGEMWRCLNAKGHWSGEISNRRKNGEVYAELLTISAVQGAHGNVLHYVALFSDISALKEHASQLERIAHYDTLTGLPNRVLLSDRLSRGMSHSVRQSKVLAVAFLDLDGFKEVNDNHGHEAGDYLLSTLAGRMQQVLRETDTLSRLGGDEFVAVMLDLEDDEACLPMLERLLTVASSPVEFEGKLLHVSASVGVTFYSPEDDVEADQLLRQADQAMYQAKLAGKNRYKVFNPDRDRSMRGTQNSIERIRQALTEREFVLHYQPKVDMQTGAVIGVEALIRWLHPEHGLLSPAAFLHVIEDHPLAVELGEWVLDTALSQVGVWRGSGVNLPISINVFVRQLRQEDFVERLGELLQRHPDVRAGDIELELRELSAFGDVAQVSAVMRACEEMGVGFSIDNFGTGYSSLAYLKSLPAHRVKIDQSFVSSMLDDPDSLAVLQGVLGLTTAFSRQVIAEGVETLAHGETLLQLGCRFAQGYCIAHPMPADSVPGWLDTWQPSRRWLDRAAMSDDQLVMLFAEVEHRAWVAAIETRLRDPLSKLPALDRHQCRFGKWLDGKLPFALDNQSTFEALNVLHERIHAKARELIGFTDAGEHDAARERLPELHALRDTLLGQLQRLYAE